MQRLLVLFLAVGALTPSAHAQPAPDAPPAVEPPPANAPPANPPPANPPPENPPPANPPPANPPPPEPEKKAEDMPKKLSVGKSEGAFFVPGALLQGWFVSDWSSVKDAAGNSTTINGPQVSTFRMRRAELSVNGEIIPKFLKFRVMFDPARVRDTLTKVNAVDAMGNPVVVSTPVSALSTFQDFNITFQSEFADVTVGQFKIPVSWEGYNSSSKIIMPERAFSSTVFGDKRDLGIKVEKQMEKFGYYAGIFNGSGQDNFDINPQKDLALRLEAYPIKGMMIGAMAYDSVGCRNRAGTKDRWEGDFRYETGPFLVQSEFIYAQDVTKNDATSCAVAAGKCNSLGFYAVLGYKIPGLGSGNWKGDLQPVVRIGYYDPDLDNDVDGTMPATAPGDPRTDIEIGLNYYLRGNELKLQAVYDRQQFSNTDLKPAVNEVILAAQASF